MMLGNMHQNNRFFSFYFYFTNSAKPPKAGEDSLI